MVNCELCGKNIAIYDAEIEGTTMHVCQECSKFGKIKNKTNVKIVVEDRKKPEIKEPVYTFFPGYGSIVKAARERLGLKQDELAKKLNERESVLHQIESGHFTPGIELAKKLERNLHIKIFEEVKEEDQSSGVTAAKSTDGPTLGDFMKKR